MNVIEQLQALKKAKQEVLQELFELTTLYNALEQDVLIERLELCYKSEYNYALHEEKIQILVQTLYEIEAILFTPEPTLRESVVQLKRENVERLEKNMQILEEKQKDWDNVISSFFKK